MVMDMFSKYMSEKDLEKIEESQAEANQLIQKDTLVYFGSNDNDFEYFIDFGSNLDVGTPQKRLLGVYCGQCHWRYCTNSYHGRSRWLGHRNHGFD